ncbi:MAG TPA: MFS transporter [Streptosporangiaceae bacterium]|nr:MFS transporter [Streptosporangiaceae bacterium]
MTHGPTSEAERPADTARPAWRDVYILGGMRGLSFAGDIMAETAILLYLTKHGAIAYAVTALLLAGVVPPALLAPVTGAIADRFDSRLLIVTVAAVQALVCAVMVLWPHPILLIAMSVLLSAGLSFTHPVFAGLPKPMVGAANVPRASSISQTYAMTGMVAAPAVAGVLTASYGVRISLVIDGLSFVLVIVGGLLIRTRLHPARDAAAAGAGSTGEQQGTAPAYRIRSDRFLWSVLALAGTVIAFVSTNNVLLVFYVLRSFHATGTTFGIISSCWMVGLIAGGITVRKLSQVRQEVVLIGTLVCLALGVLCTGLAPTVWWIAPFYVLGGIGNGAMATELHVVLNLRIPDSHRGRGFAALGAVSNVAPALGYVLGATALTIMAPRIGFILAGSIALAAIIVLFRNVIRPADETATVAVTA